MAFVSYVDGRLVVAEWKPDIEGLSLFMVAQVVLEMEGSRNGGRSDATRVRAKPHYPSFLALHLKDDLTSFLSAPHRTQTEKSE